MSHRKSIAQHKQDGTFRPSIHGPRISTKPGQVPAKPRGLSPDVGRMWDRLLELLAGRLQPEDGALLEMAATWYVRWRDYDARLAGTEFATIDHARALSAVSVASQRFEAVAKRLGLSPVDRTALPEAPNKNGAISW